ncbi:MAG: ERCC4 domain-containing protein [Candidatus Sumerlaeota bacterium]|nr:ERCC4 domain-containing protein [Candidatus Sumerlaeota bacterium]
MKIQPCILIDTREQTPLRFERFPSERATLAVGDYGLRGFSDWENPAFILERKSLEDLAGSLGRERPRFLREIEKMRAFRFHGLVIEATPDAVEMKLYRADVAPSAIMGTLDALAVRAGLHVFWCGDPAGAARRVESLAEKFIRGIQKDYERLQTVCPCQEPGASAEKPTRARREPGGHVHPINETVGEVMAGIAEARAGSEAVTCSMEV